MPAVADLASQEENPVIEINIQDVDLGMPPEFSTCGEEGKDEGLDRDRR